MRPIVATLIALAGAGVPAAEELPEKAELAALRDEMRKVEVALEYQKRVLPPTLGYDAEAESSLRGLAAQAGLSPVELRLGPASQPVAYPDGRRSPVEVRPLEISGRDLYQTVDRYLDRLSSSPRLFELQALSLKAAPDDTVAFTIRLGLPYCTDPCSGHVEGEATFQDATLDKLAARRKALEDERRAAVVRGNPQAHPDVQKAALQEQRTLVERGFYLEQAVLLRRATLGRQQFLDLLVDLDARYKASRRIVAALERLTWNARSSAFALTEVRFDGQAVLQGLSLGAGAQQALKPALDAAGFAVASVKTSPAGECQAFTATAQLKPGEIPGEVFLGNGLFDDQAPGLCSAPKPATVTRIEATGSNGGVSFRLRGVAAADVVRTLHETTGQGFVVDPDVNARMSADVQNATPEDVLAALAKSGLAVGTGDLRRVSRTARPATTPKAPPYTGQPISVSFTRGDLRDILCLFKTITGTPVWAPGDLEAKVTVFARDVPWDQVLDAAAASLGLVFVNEPEKERAFLGPEPVARNPEHPGAEEPCGPGPAGKRPTRMQQLRDQPAEAKSLSVSDLKLVGLAQIDGAWYGYAYAYSSLLVSLGPGTELLDGKVTSVDSTSVSLKSAKGVTRLSLD
jgi:hypothetical protein